ncbi:hypothetical protein EVAR_18307_1 [Eumeta japonica]|uniref:Uncharacterized protein n=1 Tax=Eumeta variegata TaxID=151549 RepID=A0A4C1V9U5_EUMVA|nr:hypothetical protein EVAR_18307_1 [Eumeta japonica]
MRAKGIALFKGNRTQTHSKKKRDKFLILPVLRCANSAFFGTLLAYEDIKHGLNSKDYSYPELRYSDILRMSKDCEIRQPKGCVWRIEFRDIAVYAEYGLMQAVDVDAAYTLVRVLLVLFPSYRQENDPIGPVVCVSFLLQLIVAKAAADDFLSKGPARSDFTHASDIVSNIVPLLMSEISEQTDQGARGGPVRGEGVKDRLP